LISNRIDPLSFIAENDHHEDFTDKYGALRAHDTRLLWAHHTYRMI
jgi:hypothetical protein